jgi:hypothetical protein
MRPAALSMAVLLGIATLGGATQAHATPTLSATIVIESERTVLVGGKRHHGHGFHRGPAPYRHKGLARHHKRWHDDAHHRPAFVAKRVHKAPVVIVKPAYGRSFGYRHLPARPLIRNGSFARGPYHW